MQHMETSPEPIYTLFQDWEFLSDSLTLAFDAHM